MEKQVNRITPTYGPLVDVCRLFGISRSIAFELAASGKLDTFKFNARRYVYLESVESLPRRLACNGGV